MRSDPRARASLLLILLLLLAAPAVAQPVASVEAACARTWLGREADLEAYMRQAAILRLEPIPLGVTGPMRAFLPEDGPVLSMAWKPIRPGIYQGRRESYRSEIAAYLMDRLLGLGMVPPTIERRHRGELGAAILWVSPVRMWRELTPEEFPSGTPWAMQIIRQRMFDNLISNDDRNQGNLLIDPDGHLSLIDHSRAFGNGRGLIYRLERVDAALWHTMAALTEPSLTEAVGEWLGRGQIRAMLRRRDAMARDIAKAIATRGEAYVLLRPALQEE